MDDIKEASTGTNSNQRRRIPKRTPILMAAGSSNGEHNEYLNHRSPKRRKVEEIIVSVLPQPATAEKECTDINNLSQEKSLKLDDEKNGTGTSLSHPSPLSPLDPTSSTGSTSDSVLRTSSGLASFSTGKDRQETAETKSTIQIVTHECSTAAEIQESEYEMDPYIKALLEPLEPPSLEGLFPAIPGDNLVRVNEPSAAPDARAVPDPPDLTKKGLDLINNVIVSPKS